MKNIILLITISLISLTSCTREWLEKKPDISATIPASLKDCQSLLDNNSLFNSRLPVLGEIASDGYYISNMNYLNISQEERNAYTWSNEPKYSTSADWIDVQTTGSYGRIFTCNLILETLEKIEITTSNEDEYNSVKGQALFLRGKSYYELAQVYAAPYDPGTQNDGLGLPMRLETDINITSTRSSVQQTYTQILSDLNESVNLLPNSAISKTRASKSAAYSMLARICNGMEDYEKAGKFANSALLLQNNLIDFSKLDGNKTYPIEMFNPEVIFYSELSTTLAVPIYTRIAMDVKDLYEANDLRNTIFFRMFSGEVVFRGFYSGTRVCFNGLATDELFLIRAESYARAGDAPNAMKDINTLLLNRWRKINGITTYVDQIASNAEEALKIVLLERRKELLLRGLRWTDLRRLNRDPRFATTVTRTVNGKTFTLEPNSYKYTFPIPEDVIRMSGIPQNPGWEK